MLTKANNSKKTNSENSLTFLPLLIDIVNGYVNWNGGCTTSGGVVPLIKKPESPFMSNSIYVTGAVLLELIINSGSSTIVPIEQMLASTWYCGRLNSATVIN